MAFLREIAVSLRAGLATAVVRPRHTLLIAFGLLIAGVTLAILLTLPAGLRRLAGNSGLPDVALVLPGSVFSTESSGTFRPELAALVGSLPGVAHDAGGRPLVAPQFVVATRLRRTDGTTATVLVRGVTPVFWQVVGNGVAMRAGRRFVAGRDELIAGAGVARGFVALDAGDTVSIHATPWRVSGDFATDGGFWESELWAGMAALQSAYRAPGRLTCMWVKLSSPAAFAEFSRALHADPRLQALRTVRQRAYYTAQAPFLRRYIAVATEAIVLALGLGAILAVINALGVALAARRREFAILRAVGFRRGALAVALLAEVLVIGAVCAGVAVLIAWLAVNGHEVGSSTMAGPAIRFRVRVDGSVVGWTFLYLLCKGLPVNRLAVHAFGLGFSCVTWWVPRSVVVGVA